MKTLDKTKQLECEIIYSLQLGEFIFYNGSYEFIDDLEDVKKKLDSYFSKNKTPEVLALYEMFLSGCYEKIEEIDDSSGGLGMFFEELFCSWIKARQALRLDPEETIQQIFKWMDNDGYGFCYNIEDEIIKVFNKKTLKHFKAIVLQRYTDSFSRKNSDRLNDYNYTTSYTADVLKKIAINCNDIASYVLVTDKIGLMPDDCQKLAEISVRLKEYQDAYNWVEKGLELSESAEVRHSSQGLKILQRELLVRLGRSEEALSLSWEEYKKCPTIYKYEELMTYVPENEKEKWYNNAIAELGHASLSSVIDICLKTAELNILTDHVERSTDEQLERLSHYTTAPAAKALETVNAAAAIKVYKALALRILNAAKSKYYRYSLEYLTKIKELCLKKDDVAYWDELVSVLRLKHKRKRSFIGDFEDLVAGKKPEVVKPVKDRLIERWKKQTK